MGISSILDTAKQAIFAQQKALQVVGNNIANVNTPGYSRQRPVILPVTPNFNTRALNGGVTIDQVQRMYDKFIGAQINTANANLQSAKSQDDLLSQIEALFNDLGAAPGGLANSLEELFQGFQELANNPQGVPERTMLQQRGTLLVNAFHDLHNKLANLVQDMNGMLSDEVSEANNLVNKIAELNLKIQEMEVDPKNPANTLRDQRDVVLKQLAEIVEITSFEDTNGQVTVLLGTGRPLVEGARANSLTLVADPDDPKIQEVRMRDAQGNLFDISSNITGGTMHGIITTRDTLVPSFKSSVDRLAAQLISSVNQTHANGYGADGSTSTNFFVPRTVSGQPLSQNTGGATLQSVSVFDASQLTLDDYRINFTATGPPATFNIVNASTGANVATGQTYTSGAAIRFGGIEVVLANGSGAPVNGDVFLINGTRDTANAIALDPAILNDVQKIAAGATPLPGDNANALALSQLRDATTIDGTTFGTFYGNLVSRVGLEKRNSAILTEQRQLVLTEVENRRESLSGVSLEEEQLDLIRFQQAFNAAAQFVRVADEMGQTILNLVQ
jgi:flagellar hook-associated protein 1 FlgK